MIKKAITLSTLILTLAVSVSEARLVKVIDLPGKTFNKEVWMNTDSIVGISQQAKDQCLVNSMVGLVRVVYAFKLDCDDLAYDLNGSTTDFSKVFEKAEAVPASQQFLPN